MNKDSFVFYREWKDALRELPADERCAVYEAIIDYATTGKTSELSQVAKFAFGFMRGTLDRDNLKWEDIRRKRSEAGKKHSGNQHTQTEPNGTNGTNVPKMEQVSQKWNKCPKNGTNGTVYVNVNEDVNVKKEKNKKENPQADFCLPLSENEKIKERKTKFKKPSIDEIKAYCTERNNGIDAESFFYYYEAREWKTGNSKIKDWKACVLTWEKRQKEKKQANYKGKDGSKPEPIASADEFKERL